MTYKSFLFTVLTICLLLCFTACSQFCGPTILDLDSTSSSQPKENEQVTTEDFQENDPRDDSKRQEPQHESTNHEQTSNNEESGVTLEFFRGLESGTLLYTITDARIVTDQDDIPSDGDFISTPSIWQIIDGEEQGYDYPDFIAEDGRFIEDCYLILVDVSIKSDNAIGVTDPQTRDFDDPYLFRASNLTLVDMTDTDPQGFYYVTEASYFSSPWNDYKEGTDPCVIHLEPGEEKRYTFGFFIGGYKSDGSKTDLSQLCLCNTYGNPDSILVKLGLGD